MEQPDDPDIPLRDNFRVPNFVKQWVDYSSKYGLAYQLIDGKIGIYFNDNTKMIQVDDDNAIYLSVPKGAAGRYPDEHWVVPLKNYPPEFNKKMTLFFHFVKYFEKKKAKGR